MSDELLKFVNGNFQNNYGENAIVINSAQIYKLDEMTIYLMIWINDYIHIGKWSVINPCSYSNAGLDKSSLNLGHE